MLLIIGSPKVSNAHVKLINKQSTAQAMVHYNIIILYYYIIYYILQYYIIL